MTLRQAIRKATVLRINGIIVSEFELVYKNRNVKTPFTAEVNDGRQSWFMTEKGLENAFFRPDHNVWETACGIIECCKLVNILDSA